MDDDYISIKFGLLSHTFYAQHNCNPNDITIDEFEAIQQQMNELGVDLMKTKQEYIDALECITKEYYSTVRFPEECNKFNSYFRLFKELIDEHFKEKQETNLEHYKDRIIELCINELAISKGKVVECCAIPCSECDFEDKTVTVLVIMK